MGFISEFFCCDCDSKIKSLERENGRLIDDIKFKDRCLSQYQNREDSWMRIMKDVRDRNKMCQEEKDKLDDVVNYLTTDRLYMSDDTLERLSKERSITCEAKRRKQNNTQ